jgi:hypothetical protein
MSCSRRILASGYQLSAEFLGVIVRIAELQMRDAMRR